MGLMRCCCADHRYSWMFGTLQVPGLKPPAVLKAEWMEAVLGGLGNGDSRDGEGCRLVALGTGRKATAPPADLQLGNRVSALTAMSTRAGRAQALQQHREGQGQQAHQHGHRWSEQGKGQYTERYIQVQFYVYQKPVI